jgi:hypothetical protein
MRRRRLLLAVLAAGALSAPAAGQVHAPGDELTAGWSRADAL